MKRFSVLSVFLLILIAPVFSQERLPRPVWGAEGKLINDSPGNTLQQNPRLALLSSGDSIVVFEDSRNGHSDIYAQKVGRQGKILWGSLAQPVCTSPRDQLSPLVIADNEGGAIIVWQDDRNGNFDIYAQRIDNAGSPVWPNDGIPICSASNGQIFPQLVSDGQGGAVILWQDYRSGAEDLYAQRIDPEGRSLWLSDGVPVCAEPGSQWQAQLISDGAGGAIAAWTDRRTGNADLYAQRLNPNGRPLWKTEGVAVAVGDSNQEHAALASDGYQGAMVAWKDADSLILQRIGSDGNLIFSAPGIIAVRDAAAGSFPQIAGDGSGGAVLAWSDPKAGDPDLYLQYVNPAGQVQWGETGRILLALRGVQTNPRISGTGPWMVVWEDGRDKDSQGKQLYAQRIGRDGYYYWAVTGVLVSDTGVDPQEADLVMGQNGEALIFYQDHKRGNFDIFAQKVAVDARLVWGKNGIIVCNVAGSVAQQEVRTVGDGKGGYLFAFEDFRNGFSNIYLQRVNDKGNLLWDRLGVAAAPGAYNQRNPRLIADGEGGMIVAFEDFRDPLGGKIYAQRIDFAGQTVWDRGGELLTPGSRASQQSQPQIASDGKGGAVVVFLDLRNPINYTDIYSQRLDKNGKLLWAKAGNRVSAGNGSQDEVGLADNLEVVWTDYRNGDKNSDIFAQKLDLTGATLWAEDGVPVCEAPDSQKSPCIISRRGGGSIVVWTDRGGGSFDVYAQRLDDFGRQLWAKDGIPIEQSARTQQNPRLVLDPADRAVVVWEDFRFGNWDIFAQRVDEMGNLTWGETGVIVSEAENTQYAPALLQLKPESIIAWEDYRSGQNYSIYLEVLGSAGDKINAGLLIQASRFGARKPQLASTKNNEFLVAWEDCRGGGCGIIAQKFTF
ncbi:MAG: hypothetical protein WC645_00130 [Candidatus Margulisiibacteriota bacterium]